jgi:hypothetical protein
MGFVILESDSKVLAERAELVIGWRREGFVLVEQPKKPLVSAKHTGMGRKKPANTFEPTCEKRRVESRVMSNELGHSIAAAIGRDHVNSGVTAKKCREAFPGSLLGNGLAVPHFRRVMFFAPTSRVDESHVEAELSLDRFEFP